MAKDKLDDNIAIDKSRPQDFGDTDDSGVAYTLGMKEVPLNSPVAYAKKTNTSKGELLYAVKMGPDGMLFDPSGMYSEGKQYKSNERMEGLRWRRVGEKCFGFYSKFLETQNPAFLRNAEREVANFSRPTPSQMRAKRDIKFVGGVRG